MDTKQIGWKRGKCDDKKGKDKRGEKRKGRKKIKKLMIRDQIYHIFFDQGGIMMLKSQKTAIDGPSKEKLMVECNGSLGLGRYRHGL